MPKLTKSLPSYRLHKRSGQAVVTLSGVDRYLGPYGSPESHDAYDRAIAEWLVEGRIVPGTTEVPDSITIIELMAAFMEWADTYYRRADGTSTAEPETIALALRPLKALYAHLPASEFGPKKLTAVREAMIKLGWCRNVCNKQTGRIRAMFRWAVERELMNGTAVAYLSLEG